MRLRIRLNRRDLNQLLKREADSGVRERGR